MKITYRHIIENCFGEKLIFKELRAEPGGDRLIVENYVAPGQGPLMLTHWLQDESLTVVHGQIGFQIMGQPAQFANAHTIVFFLTSVYAAQNKSGKSEPEAFDGAYLLTRYSSEYDLPEIPSFVKKMIIPVTYFIGRILGKYKHFRGAPEPVSVKIHQSSERS